jgi:hypothetical protein
MALTDQNVGEQKPQDCEKRMFAPVNKCNDCTMQNAGAAVSKKACARGSALSCRQ